MLNYSVRHCGLDPQSPENKEILKQVQNDGKGRSSIIFSLSKILPNKIICQNFRLFFLVFLFAFFADTIKI